MTFDEESSELTLTSGRVIYANRGILGIDHMRHVTEGYDGGVSFYYEELTEAERAEIAEEMIKRWTQWMREGPRDDDE